MEALNEKQVMHVANLARLEVNENELKKYCDNNDLEMDIEVDGGINDITGKDAVEAGANILVSGSYVVNADDFKVAIESLKNI